MIPKIIYGTAWKEDRTKDLVSKALKSGYRAIDTANQRKHYHEAQIGEAIQEWFSLDQKRDELFLQSKFTYINGQDHRLPYDPRSSLNTQVKQSFESSLIHLKTTYLDSYLIHGPYSPYDFTDNDWEVWEAMEELYDLKKVKSLGVSNVGLNHIKTLFENAKIKPTWVQNRCFANRGWDQNVRQYCIKNGISYQGFSLLTANPYMFQHPKVNEISSRTGKTSAQVIFQFTTKIGITPLTGTTQEIHMIQDLDFEDIQINEEDINILESAL